MQDVILKLINYGIFKNNESKGMQEKEKMECKIVGAKSRK